MLSAMQGGQHKNRKSLESLSSVANLNSSPGACRRSPSFMRRARATRCAGLMSGCPPTAAPVIVVSGPGSRNGNRWRRHLPAFNLGQMPVAEQPSSQDGPGCGIRRRERERACRSSSRRRRDTVSRSVFVSDTCEDARWLVFCQVSADAGAGATVLHIREKETPWGSAGRPTKKGSSPGGKFMTTCWTLKLDLDHPWMSSYSVLRLGST